MCTQCAPRSAELSWSVWRDMRGGGKAHEHSENAGRAHAPLGRPCHHRPSDEQSASGIGSSGINQPHHQTLPLKSNLKKTGGGGNINNGSSGSAQKLQWNQSTTSRSSLEELRV